MPIFCTPLVIVSSTGFDVSRFRANGIFLPVIASGDTCTTSTTAGFLPPTSVSRSICTPEKIVSAPTVYGSVSISPDFFELGLIEQDIELNYRICNNYNYPRQISNIVSFGSLLDVTINTTVGDHFLGQECKTYQMSISTINNSVIDGGWVFTFATGEELSLTVTGERAALPGYSGCMITPITRTLSFDTKISRTINGTEHRVATRKYPRDTYDTGWYFESSFYRNIIDATNYLQPITVPNNFFSVVVRAIAAGSESIAADFTGFNVQIGSAVLIEDLVCSGKSEIVVVGSYDANAINILYPVISSYSVARVSSYDQMTINSVALKRQLDYQQTTVNAERRFFYNNPATSSDRQIDTDFGLKLYKFIPIQTSYDLTVETGVERIDYSRGNWELNRQYKAPIKSYQITQGFQSLAEYQFYVDFFISVIGSYESFLIPTFTRDFSLLSNGLLLDKIKTENNQHTEVPLKNKIAFITSCQSGCASIIFAEIIDFLLDDTGLELNLDRSININSSDVVSICYANESRFDGDLVTTRDADLWKTTISIIELQRGKAQDE